MVICFLANAASIHTERWARYFAGRGYDVHVISLSAGLIPNVSVHHVPPRGFGKAIGYLLALPAINRLVKEIRPDILHAHYATSYGLLGALTGYHPLVITAWGSDVLLEQQRSRLMRSAVQFALARADLVTSMANHMTRTIVDLGILRDKVLTLPFGADTTIFHPGVRSQVREEDIDILCNRPCEPVYNVELLIRALPTVVKRHTKVRCALMGGGSLRPRLGALAAKLGVAPNITWIDRLPLPEVAHWLARAKVFVTPSLSDGNNISLNEAMACGCFPIASDIPANREWVVNGENGFLVPPDHPDELGRRIVEALGYEDLRQGVRERNWGIVQERGNWQKNVAAMEPHYRRLSKPAARSVV